MTYPYSKGTSHLIQETGNDLSVGPQLFVSSIICLTQVHIEEYISLGTFI